MANSVNKNNRLQTFLQEPTNRHLWFYLLIICYMMGGAIFIGDFIYRYKVLLQKVSEGLIVQPAYLWDKKNLFLEPILVSFFLDAFITWFMVRNFKIEILKKSIYWYLLIVVSGWIYIGILNLLNVENFFPFDFGIYIIPLFWGHYAIQNQTIFAFWILIFFPLHRQIFKGIHFRITSFFIKLIILLIMVYISFFLVVIKFLHYAFGAEIVYKYNL